MLHVFLFALFVCACHQVPFAPCAGASAKTNIVVALPVVVGTRSVEMPQQAGTRGPGATRLAKVRSQIRVFLHTQPSGQKGPVTQMLAGLHEFWLNNFATYISPRSTVWTINSSILGHSFVFIVLSSALLYYLCIYSELTFWNLHVSLS